MSKEEVIEYIMEIANSLEREFSTSAAMSEEMDMKRDNAINAIEANWKES